jgi:hypothetical protein
MMFISINHKGHKGREEKRREEKRRGILQEVKLLRFGLETITSNLTVEW